MTRTFLLLDCDYLCHLAFFSLGKEMRKRPGDSDTAVIFGFFNYVLSYMERFGTCDAVFCWDQRPYLRKKLFPLYKSKSELEKASMEQQYKQIGSQRQLLRDRLVYQVGFHKNFSFSGYEADDIIAVVSKMLEPNDVIMVSADEDLYQLLSERVSMYKPRQHKLYTMQHLWHEYGIPPSEWPEVKAMAGCVSDTIPGIPSVGPITAAKYLRGKLETHTKAYQRIIASKDIVKRNRELVTLPFPGMPEIHLRGDKVTEEKWQSLCDEFKLNSLRNQVPIPARFRRKSLYG